MPTPRELEAQFWKALKSDMTMMVGLVGEDDSHMRPLTAQIEGDHADGYHGPIWFFSSTETTLVRELVRSNSAVATFASKGHDLFATVHGQLWVDNDRRVIDALWNSFIAAWYEGGKDDPKLALLRLDANNAEIWLNASSLLAGIKILLGSDPKKGYKENVAKVSLK
jgi:general stress protein 26